MPDQQQLIEQIVLEPEHDLVVRGVRLEDGVRLAIPREDIVFERFPGTPKPSDAR